MFFWKNIFLTPLLIYGFLAVAVLYVVSFIYPEFTDIAEIALVAMSVFVVIDLILLLTSKKGLTGKRILNEKLSNSDNNEVKIQLRNHYGFRIRYNLLEELPVQFQIFDFNMSGLLSPNKEVDLKYNLKPNERGVYKFGNTNGFVQSPIGLLQRRVILKTQAEIKVYPSFLRINNFSLSAFRANINELGQKKIRRIGHSMEFEQIKNYVQGDDFRTINWKATAKHRQLMVNQYVDEKSQQIYCAIDKGRVMKMPFNDMSLLDYAINSALVFSNVVLQNQDRAGIFTFSSQLEDLVKAEKRVNQLQKISETLYNIKSDFKESDFGKLYNSLKHKITQRSLILLYTNFESMDSLHRQLPYLQAINKNHLLVLVFFKNTELEDFVNNSNTETDIYQKTIAQKFIYEKQQIVLELNRYSIHTVLTRPEDLSVNAINKYLEVKSKGLI